MPCASQTCQGQSRVPGPVQGARAQSGRAGGQSGCAGANLGVLWASPGVLGISPGRAGDQSGRAGGHSGCAGSHSRRAVDQLGSSLGPVWARWGPSQTFWGSVWTCGDQSGYVGQPLQACCRTVRGCWEPVQAVMSQSRRAGGHSGFTEGHCRCARCQSGYAGAHLEVPGAIPSVLELIWACWAPK